MDIYNVRRPTIKDKSVTKYIMGNKHSSSHEVVAAEVGSTSSSSIPPRKLLHGCSTLEEHNEVIRHVISSSSSSSMGGEEQLKTLGFEYRFVPCCSVHASSHDNMNDNCCHQCATRLFYVGRLGQGKRKEEEQEQRENKHVDAQDENQSNADKVCNKQTYDSSVQQHKQEEEAIMITPTNRQQFIADGAMYDAIATCSQQVVHDKMCKAFDLQWVTVCDEHQQHIRALVDKDHTMLLEEDENRWVVQELLNDNEEKKGDDDEEEENSSAMLKSTSKIKPPTSTNRTKTTLLIATGRGKVRAGIFSRHHRKLLTGTAIILSLLFLCCSQHF